MKPRNSGLQLIFTTVLALIAGTAVAEYAPVSDFACLAAAGLLLAAPVLRQWTPSAAGFLHRWRLPRLLIVVALLASARWTMVQQSRNAEQLHQLALQQEITLVQDVVVASVPVDHQRPHSQRDHQQNRSRRQTRFLASVRTIYIHGRPVPASGTLRVFVEGSTGRRFGRGDIVQLTGRLSWPDPPGNPGELNFAAFLQRRGCAGMVFVAHPDAIQVQQRAGRLSAGYWLTRLRRAAEDVLKDAVDAENLAIASALLLGSRSEIPAETQETFIGSGTMHLLAISGLHLGILCLLLVRLGNWLLIPWNQRLVMIVAFCVTYALITDLRPSVVRATVFAILVALSQISLRQVSSFAVIGQSACLMLVLQPHLVFDTGAWLSFLSVTSLVLAGKIMPFRLLDNSSPGRDRPAPIPITPMEHLQAALVFSRQWLASRLRPMLWILAATVPLTACEFHVLSPVGIGVNLILIPWTVLTLWLGFTTLFVGLLLPFASALPGWAFSLMLSGLTSMARLSAGTDVGHQYLPDLPAWFLPAWYLLLLAVVMFRRSRHRQLAWLGLCCVASFTLLDAATVRPDDLLRCTILDVGHGSAAIVTTPGGDALLVDGGAMHRADRAGEIISRCLWAKGHRSIRSVVISHADVDHFNGLGAVLTRFRVGELIVSQQFLHNTSPAARALRALAERQHIPIRIAVDGDICHAGETHIRIFQADPHVLAKARSDNEKSLVVRISRFGKSILLPGDLEGEAMDHLLPQLGRCDILVSPHHGSRKANTAAVARQLDPQHIIVSARDASSRVHLRSVSDSASLYFTSECGALDVTIDQHGRLHVSPFRTADNTTTPRYPTARTSDLHIRQRPPTNELTDP